MAKIFEAYIFYSQLSSIFFFTFFHVFCTFAAKNVKAVLKSFQWPDRSHTLGFCRPIWVYKTLNYGADRPIGRCWKVVGHFPSNMWYGDVRFDGQIDQNRSKVAHRVPKVAKIGHNRLIFFSWWLFTAFLYDSDMFTADSKANIDKIAIWRASRALNSPQNFFRQKKKIDFWWKKKFFFENFWPQKNFFQKFFSTQNRFFFLVWKFFLGRLNTRKASKSLFYRFFAYISAWNIHQVRCWVH